MALLALVSSSRSCASFSLRVSENRATPSTATFRSGGVWEKVSASTRSESDSWSVFSPLIVVVRSPRASGSWYGDVVRSTGMVCDRWPSPRGVTSRYLVPSRLLVLIAASVRSPSRMFLSTLNFTSTCWPSSSMLVTWPAWRPDTCTSALPARPPASSKYAEYVLPGLRRTAASGSSAPSESARSVPMMPTRPMTKRLRSANDFIAACTSRCPDRRPSRTPADRPCR